MVLRCLGEQYLVVFGKKYFLLIAMNRVLLTMNFVPCLMHRKICRVLIQF